ncbi:MAG: hypothetical protein M1823_007285, partial [Watsoniomyces obsoletus]
MHVPAWLIAINESVADYVSCAPLPHFHGDEYAAIFGANIHVQPRAQRPLPLGLPTPDRQTPVKAQNYQNHFVALLREELAALEQQLFHYSLYNHHIVMWDPQQLLFKVCVPGLRENSPRIDLGDTVHVRPINPIHPSVAQSQNKAWRDYMQKKGMRHPAFFGTDYRAVVWRLDRAKEAVFLRIDNGG